MWTFSELTTSYFEFDSEDARQIIAPAPSYLITPMPKMTPYNNNVQLVGITLGNGVKMPNQFVYENFAGRRTASVI